MSNFKKIIFFTPFLDPIKEEQAIFSDSQKASWKMLARIITLLNYSPMAHKTNPEKKKGRPKSTESKSHHFTVWTSEIQKNQIQAIVQTSGLSASEFFLHLALNHRLKLPKRKGLPVSILIRIQLLEKLSGILTLIAIKTKDKDFLSTEWLESSANIKQISVLLLL